MSRFAKGLVLDVAIAAAVVATVVAAFTSGHQDTLAGFGTGLVVGTYACSVVARWIR